MDRAHCSATWALAHVLIFAWPAAVWADDVPTGIVTLRDAVAAALRHNPELGAASLTVQASDGRRVQAGLLPNPTVSAEAENVGASGRDDETEPPQTTLRLAQLIELGGKRAKRQRLAALERDAAQWDYEVRRATVAADAARAFVAVLALQEQRALSAELVGLAEESLRAVEKQIGAGAAAPADGTRARVVLGEAKLALADRERELAAARGALAAAWGAAQPTFERASGDLADIAPPDEAATAIDANPDVARWTTELAAREAALSLERARAVPDVTVAAGPRIFIDSGEVAGVFELGLPLPLFDRNQGGVAAATADIAAAGARQRGATLAVRAAVRRETEQLRAAHTRAAALRDDLIPAAHATFTAARDAYRLGAVRYLEVLDAQRTWFALRDQYLSALAAYHTARIDLERLVGADLGGD